MKTETTTHSPPIDDTFHTEQVMTIAGGHFVHDTYSAFIAPLLPLIQERLGTGYALTGSLAIFAQLPSLLNPFIGYLADRISLRYFIILAPAITATLMSFMGLAPTYLSLALVLLAAGVSIAAFHAPAPAMIARVSGRRVGTGMSIFMASGELGRTLGPVFVVAGVTWFGLEGIWRLMFAGWAVSGILYLRLRHVSARPQTGATGALADIMPTVRRIFPLLILLMLVRSLIAISLTTYLPIYMSDVKEAGIWLSAAALTILEGAGVAGALATGTLSDRFGRFRILTVLLLLAPIFMLVFLYSPSWLTIPLLIILGLTAISPTPVLLALIQDNFTQSRALANGLFLAANFLIRAFGIWAVGFLADQFGLQTAFLWSAILGFLTLPAAWALAKTHDRI
ncbi:MAG: MFS transporter [Ardenticatenaceae bacterium]|nr:MFS transporter [Ardenticatenaceae bacterium]